MLGKKRKYGFGKYPASHEAALYWMQSRLEKGIIKDAEIKTSIIWGFYVEYTPVYNTRKNG